MATIRTFTDKTGAADKSIGFDYQYYYFLDKLLQLKVGQAVGLEMLDDVHTTLDTNIQLLFQLKHTTNYAANGQPINLTQLDDDLWKTLSNWAQVIVDKHDNRAGKPEQIAFVKKTEFHLVTNKSWSSQNAILQKISDFNDEKIEFKELRKELENLFATTQNATIGEYIQHVLNLNDSVSEKFFARVRFELGYDDITARIRQSIAEKAIPDALVDAVFERLDSNVREDNFIAIKAGQKILITYEEFKTRYQKIFTAARDQKLTYYTYKPQLPDNLFSQRFVSQLLHIKDVDSSEIELIAEYTTHKLRLARNLTEWQNSGQLVSDEVNDFHKDVKLQWRNRFRNTFRPEKVPPDVFAAAVDLLNNLRTITFKIAGEELNTELCNGELYHLSDFDLIGWHPDWENL